jgi:hypothetical protein
MGCILFSLGIVAVLSCTKLEFDVRQRESLGSLRLIFYDNHWRCRLQDADIPTHVRSFGKSPWRCPPKCDHPIIGHCVWNGAAEEFVHLYNNARRLESLGQRDSWVELSARRRVYRFLFFSGGILIQPPIIALPLAFHTGKLMRWIECCRVQTEPCGSRFFLLARPPYSWR